MDYIKSCACALNLPVNKNEGGGGPLISARKQEKKAA